MQKWEYCHVLHTYLFSKRDTHTDALNPVYGVVVTYYRPDGQHVREEAQDMFPEAAIAILGNDGWELVSVEYDRVRSEDVDEEHMTRRVYYFKRPAR